MSDLIHLLPDSIANQIAAGEVIQRPASVVKELVENSIDAGADTIQIIIKDAGRTLVQVIDNGKGMSETDARMSFERHATSKIRAASDLFALRTMGFRGEALASIAAVATVELKTRRQEEAVGTRIQISGSEVERQESVAAAAGSNFAVKNLFFNVPARRKFLKSNETEFRNILTELERVALVYPNVAFSIRHNDQDVLSLPIAGLKQRINDVMGKKMAYSLLPVDIQTSFIKISGFIGTPESSKQRGAAQYFFANGRFLRHPYFHRAVMLAFEPFIPGGNQPNYFLYLEVDPGSIDVNIHPTKTEIKFEDERMLFQVLTSAIKEAIAVPGLEFDRAEAIDMPVYTGHATPSEPPKISYRQDYNPFKETPGAYKRPATDWESLYTKRAAPSGENAGGEELSVGLKEKVVSPEVLQLFKGRYLVTTLKSGLAVIDRRKAHIRVLYDDYHRRMTRKQGVSQRMVFPELISFSPKEASVLPCLLEDLAHIGFDLSDIGDGTYSINGIPAGLEGINSVEVLRNMVDKAIETGCEVQEEIAEALALALAQKAAIPYEKTLSEDEMQSLLAQLFASPSPSYTPDGKVILTIFTEEDIEKRFRHPHK
jgi:DNA mismatch repair protein MutL